MQGNARESRYSGLAGRLQGWTRRDSVARTKDQSLAERNRRICTYRRNGFTYSEIGDLEGVSRARVAQIVAEITPELPEDDCRAEIASLLEYAERKCVDLIEHPGYALTATGRVAEDPATGEPLQNKQVVDNALRTLMVIADRRSKTFALDKPQKTIVRVDVARQQADEALAAVAAKIAADRRELEAARRQLAAIPGQVLRELPPGGA